MAFYRRANHSPGFFIDILLVTIYTEPAKPEIMRINIVHHHLHPGGVTRVIHSQTLALKQFYPDLPVRLILGHTEDADAWKAQNMDVEINPHLNYLHDREDLDAKTVKETASHIEAYLKSLLDKKEDILHVHNLNLGKNPAMTYAIYRMAKENYRVFNHAHDFAEDRPANLKYMQKTIKGFMGADLQEVMYPGLPNYRFGVLNSYDYSRLEKYGIESNRIELLENPVAFQSEQLPDYEASRRSIVNTLNLDPEKNIITYPVRVIQRKNIGEFILLAVLFENSAEWLVTQPPKNPEEQKHYQQWTEFCYKHGINVHFEAGTKVDFEALLVASDFCITTSRQEGFGMVYLEPWLMNTPITGRDLPHITKDMKDKGISFPPMYNQLLVEHNGSMKDFKDLDAGAQRSFILNARQDEAQRNLIFSRNNFLEKLFNKIFLSQIHENREIILREYSYEKYAQKLYGSYQKSTGKSG